jgi:hypothetical protein
MTVVTNHHIVITDEEQNMIVNALAFFSEFFYSGGKKWRKLTAEEWQDVADDTDLNAADNLATKIATSN